ncbi:MAG: DUF3422 family protein [Hyphomicrobiales bacterium]
MSNPLVTTEHPQRRYALAGIHARPFAAFSTPRRISHFAYATDEAAAASDFEAFTRFARYYGAALPPSGARHCIVSGGVRPVGGTDLEWRLRWERHTEFTTHSWDTYLTDDPAAWPAALQAGKPSGTITSLTERPPAPGPLVVALTLFLVPGDSERWTDADTADWGFDPASLCITSVDQGAALIASDFRVWPDGATRILVRNLSLDAQRAGVLIQRLVEIETYRTFALLVLPAIRAASPVLDAMEQELTDLLQRKSSAQGDHRAQLRQLTDMASTLEAQMAASFYRIGAARAYDKIVAERIGSLGEKAIKQHGRLWGNFLNRRLGPALRTCATLAERQSALARRLARNTALLRTRVDIVREQQNNAVLRSMDRRAKMQLRLQQTVEGLSVAAVSYYVVGLVTYLSKGGKALGLEVAPELVSAVSVPVVVGWVWWLVRRMRRRHVKQPAAGSDTAED